jgi:hypothetical protein
MSGKYTDKRTENILTLIVILGVILIFLGLLRTGLW